MGGRLAPEQLSRRRCYDEIRHLMLVMRIALGWAIGWADEWGRCGGGWGGGVVGMTRPAPSPPAPPPRGGEGVLANDEEGRHARAICFSVST